MRGTRAIAVFAAAVTFWATAAVTVAVTATPAAADPLPFTFSQSIAAGASDTCAVTWSGAAECWGDNSYGGLGNVNSPGSTQPVGVTGLSTGVVAVTSGYFFSCALTNAGGVKCWGQNMYDNLGQGSTSPSYSATPLTPVGLSAGVASIEAEGNSACAVMTTGGVKCWGFSGGAAPTDVTGLASGVVSVAVGIQHACALTTAGGVKCWGSGQYGDLGNGSFSGASSAPSDVIGLTSGVSSIGGGDYHTCAVTTAGAVKCWGKNTYGQVGDGTNTNQSVPTAVVGLTSGATAVVGGPANSCAVVSGGVQCWGLNSEGQLGTQSIVNSSVPVVATGVGSGVAALSAGDYHTCVVLTNGQAKCWGTGDSGQLGNGSTDQFNGAVSVPGMSSGVASVSAGGMSTCAVTDAGAAQCWGNNGAGELGNGTTVPSMAPVQVTGLSSGVSSISASATDVVTGSDFTHTCAVVINGQVVCWGYNHDGELGNGTTTNASTPQTVVGLSSGATTVASGQYTSCATTAVGTVKCWGGNSDGELGNGTTGTNSSVPVTVSGIASGATSVVVGDHHVCAVVSGGAKCWGYNSWGELGNGTETDSSTPVDVAGLTSGVVALVAGWSHTCALLTTGGVKCWGAWSYIGSNLGPSGDYKRPGDVTGLTSGVAAIGGLEYGGCAVTATGSVKCWGDNAYGELGDGTTTTSKTPVTVGGVGGATAVAGGYVSACVLVSGGVQCWGSNRWGQLGSASTPWGPFTVLGNVAFGPLLGIYGTASPAPNTAGWNNSPVTVSFTCMNGVAPVTCSGPTTFNEGASQSVTGTTSDAVGATSQTTVSGVNVDLTPPTISGAPTSSPDSDGNYAAPVVIHWTCADTLSGVVSCPADQQISSYGTTTVTGSVTDKAGNTASSSVTVNVRSTPPPPISSGTSHTCAVTGAGGVMCWGVNTYGQLGAGSTSSSLGSVPVAVSGLPGLVTQVVTGASHSCARLTTGAVYCWGRNASGQLGNGSTTDSAVPVAVTGLGSGVASISAHQDSTCALTTAGAVSCWGVNGNGQLGNGTTTGATTPVAVAGLASGVSAVAQGGAHACAIRSNGSMVCWGLNGDRQLGDGTTTQATTPVTVVGLPGTPASLALGSNHTCTKLTTGALYCWGRNSTGQLGNGTTTSSGVPVAVVGLPSSVASVAANGSETCAVGTGGELRCWGSNTSGEIGNGTKTNSSAPTAPTGLSTGVAQAAPGSAFNCYLKATGAVWCSGSNASSQLGNHSRVDSQVPVPVATSGTADVAPIGTIAGGASHTCAITAVGGAKCTGLNSSGQLGDGTTTSETAMVGVLAIGNVVSLAAGGNTSCAIVQSGSLSCWGSNSNGQLGVGSTTNSSTPAGVSGLGSGVTSVVLGATSACAVVSGGVKCWGGGGSGQLGNGGVADATTPVSVTGLSSGVTAVAAGTAHACALLSAGTVQCWGANTNGQLGNSSTVSSSTPVTVSGLGGTAKAITAGGNHSCALLTTGTIRCWGLNSSGELGNNSTTNSSVPVTVSGSLSSVVSVVAGAAHSCAVFGSGNIDCWGLNSSGQLARNNTTNASTPGPAQFNAFGGVGLTISTALALGSGDNHACELQTGTLLCWGLNASGQLGLSNTTNALLANTVSGASVWWPPASPTITDSRSPAPNSAGWNNSAVTVSFTCASGAPITCSTPTTVSGNGQGQSVVGTATDSYSGSTTMTEPGISIDTVAPVTSGSPTTAPNGAGWYHGDVVVNWTCSDALSGLVVSCPATSTITGEGTGLSASVTATDLAGNASTATVGPVNIDRTTPVTTASTTPVGTSGALAFTLSATDAGSGVASTSYSIDGGPTQSGTTGTLSGNSSHTLSYWSVDVAGNVEAAHTDSFSTDVTGPIMTPLVSPAPNASGWNNSDVTVSWVCDDGPGSGVASCPSPQAVSTEGAAQDVAGTGTDVAGNSTTSHVSVSLDKTAPSTSASSVSAWSGGPVSVTLTPTDALSGVASTFYSIDGATPVSGTTPQISGEGSHTLSYWSVDVAGNIETPNVASFGIDGTGPAVTSTVNPAPNASGWNNSDVTVSWACDDGSGSGVASCPTSQSVTTEGAAQDVAGTGTDVAGNSTTSHVSVSLDKTAPTISDSLSSSPGPSGWFQGPVTVHWSCGDALSGVTSCPSDQTVSTDGVTTVNASVTDRAGNSARASVTVSIDSTPPTLVCGAGDSSWHNANVTRSCTASDGASGLANAGDASFGLSTQVAPGSANANAPTGSRQVCDVAGNCVTAGPFAGNMVDRAAPTVLISTPAPGAVYGIGAAITVATGCSDVGSGLSDCVGTLANGATLDTSTPGAKSFTVTAHDAVGNMSTATSFYTVAGNTVSGQLTDPTLGNTPVGAVNVRLYLNNAANPTLTTTTGSDGRYSFVNVPTGSWQLQFAKGGYNTDWYQGATIRPNALKFTLGAGQTFAASDSIPRTGYPITANVGGTVTDPTSGNAAVAGATVGAYAVGGTTAVLTTTTDSSGHYTLSGLAAGSYQLQFSKVGYTTSWYVNSPSQSGAHTVTLAAAQTGTANGQLAIIPVGSLGGTVTTGTGATPVAGATVTIYPSGSTTAVATATTGSDGTWRNPSLAAGTYQVQIVASGYNTAWYLNATAQASATPVSVSVGGMVTINQGLTPTPPPVQGVASGTVTSASNGLPLSGVNVRFWLIGSANPTSATTTNAAGRYTISLAPGSYQLQFAKPGNATLWWQSATLRPNATVITIANGDSRTYNAALS